jgi:hypothetical protein
LTAAKHWAAINGVGWGPQGFSFAIPTKDEKLRTLSLHHISLSIDLFIEFAIKNPKRTFLVTKIGCGLAGYSESQIAPLFKGAPENCVLPPGW